jgi:two-component system NarL family sensor kinase
VIAAWPVRLPRLRPDAHLWIASAVCTLGILSVAAEIAIYLSHSPVPVQRQMATVELWQYAAQGAPIVVVGFLLVARRAAPGLGWVLLGSATVFAAAACISTWLRFTTAITPAVSVAVYAEYGLWEVPRIAFPMLPLFFPAGRLTGRWSRFLAVLLAGTILASEASGLLCARSWHPGAVAMPNALFTPAWASVSELIEPWVQLAGWTTIGLVTVYPVTQWRTADRVRRRQIAIVFPVFLLLLVEEAVRQQQHWSAWIAGAKIALSVLGPAVLGYTVLHTRLYELDRAARRAVAIAVPVVLLAAVYAGAAAVMSTVLPGRGARMLAVLAVLAALVGLVLRPISHQVLRRIDRMLYGDRAEPYQLTRQLAARVRDEASSAQVPNAVCQVMVNALRLPGAALYATSAGGTRQLAAVGDLTPADALEPLELRYRGRVVGSLLVMARTGQRGLDELDRAALQPLADLAAAAVSAILLEEELESSRARLVNVREEERSRLRRDVHDGIGSSLAATRLRIEAAVALLPPDAVGGALLTSASDELRDILTETRHLTDNLRPPALERLGLTGALVVLARRSSTPALPVRTDLPHQLAGVPAPVELAAYRITAEAVANAVRHAAATQVTLTLSADVDGLMLTITDNGTGIGTDLADQGIGMASMAQRAADLGGTCTVRSGAAGTTVTAHLPVSGL